MNTSRKRLVFRNVGKAVSILLNVLLMCCAIALSPFADVHARSAGNDKSQGTRENKRVNDEDKIRGTQEQNEGLLPPAESFEFEWRADANLAANWFTAGKVENLREDVLETAKMFRKEWPVFPEIDQAKVKALGIRTIETEHIVFYTDLPKSDDVDEIPDALEAALPLICDFFHIDRARFQNWKAEAFLMDDVRAFIEIKALDGPPEFLYGYSMGDRIFAKKQGTSYYNRFLLTHELVHTIMHEVFGDLRPRWFSEGTAEYVGLHKWDPQHKKMKIALIPESEEETPGFGRLRQIREIVKQKNAPTLWDILNFQPRDFVDVSSYSWSWALVMFLYNSPKYKEIAEILPFWAIANDPNKLFVDAIGDRWNELENDWADFIGRIDYDYDFEATSIDFEKSVSNDVNLDSGVVVDVDVARGWQPTGLILNADDFYTITASGKFEFYLALAKRTMEFEATGASCDYFAGVPVGRLQAVVVPDVKEKTFYEIYGLEEDQDQQDKANPRWNEYQNVRVPTRNRFGVDSNGFKESEVIENVVVTSENKRKKRLQTNDTRSARRKTLLYNALYPWNEQVNLANTFVTLEPSASGQLYLRINAAPRDLKKNKGKLKVRVRRTPARENKEFSDD